MVCKLNPDDDQAEHAPAHEDYWVAWPVCPAYQIVEAGTIGMQGQLYAEGTWMVRIEWAALHEVRRDGSRVYRKACEWPEDVWPVESLVQVGGSKAVKFTACRGGQYFVLSRATHDTIMRYGAFD